VKDGRIFQPISLALHDTLVCKACTKTATPARLISADRWKEIVNTVHAANFALPSFRSAKVTFMLAESFKNGGIEL
jgi:hypothetical protein